MDEQFYVYIMASERNGTIYIGSTNDLVRRAWEHRNGVVEGFTKRYDCRLLVWYEVHGDLESARVREFRMKAWKRAWKMREIEGFNPDWEDLYDRIATMNFSFFLSAFLSEGASGRIVPWTILECAGHIRPVAGPVTTRPTHRHEGRRRS